MASYGFYAFVSQDANGEIQVHSGYRVSSVDRAKYAVTLAIQALNEIDNRIARERDQALEDERVKDGF